MQKISIFMKIIIKILDEKQKIVYTETNYKKLAEGNAYE